MSEIVKSQNPCEVSCTGCGTCCVAPDILALDKPAGVRCRHLLPDNRCDIYDERPLVCRQYRADEICLEIEAPMLHERVARFYAVFGIISEQNS